MTRKPQNQKGFTLVELMIALLVFSFVATTGVYTLRIGANAKEQLEASQKSIQQIEVTRALLKSDFMQMTTRIVRDEFGARGTSWFYGGASHPRSAVNSDDRILVSFVRGGWTNPEAAQSRSTLQRVSYLEREGKLIRRVRPYLDEARGQPFAERVLLEDASDLDFEFLRGEISGRFDWVSDWPTGGSGGGSPIAAALTFSNRRFGEIRMQFWIGNVAGGSI